MREAAVCEHCSITKSHRNMRAIVIHRLNIIMNNKTTDFRRNKMPKSPTLCFCFSPFRAEGLAVEIKDLQGQLADYNMVKF